MVGQRSVHNNKEFTEILLFSQKRVICCIRVLVFILEFEKDGTVFGFQWKMVTLLSPYCGLIRKMLGKKVGLEFFPVLFWFLKSAEGSLVPHSMTVAASLPSIQNIPVGCINEQIG